MSVVVNLKRSFLAHPYSKYGLQKSCKSIRCTKMWFTINFPGSSTAAMGNQITLGHLTKVTLVLTTVHSKASEETGHTIQENRSGMKA